MTANTTSGNSAPPQNGFGTNVNPFVWGSNGGISRNAPISQPRYQSGCAPFVDIHGWYGPHSQIGLIWTRPPSRNSTPATAASSDSERSAYPGQFGVPPTWRPGRRRSGNCGGWWRVMG